MDFDVVILGGGASGLMAAAHLNGSGLRVGIVEGNTKPGAKLRISGGGKCNLTNVTVSEKHFLGESALVKAILQQFDKAALLEWVRSRGCRPVLRKKRYYFCPNSARELIDLLRKEGDEATLLLEHKVIDVTKAGDAFLVRTDRRVLKCRRVMVATGGVSYASVGATDVGIAIAHAFAIPTVPFRPALAGLTLQKAQFWMKGLSGISFPVRIHIAEKVLREDMLFAHKGISGPAVLSASLYWEKGVISIDFLDGKSVNALVQRGGNRKLSTALPLPKRFVSAFLEAHGMPDKPCSTLTKSERASLAVLGGYRFAPAGSFGFTKAEVSKGGVSANALEHTSCESRAVKGLYFIGEVVDVTGELGGYNFQWAFASAVAAAGHIIREAEHD